MAKILIVTYTMYGAWFSLRLEEEGHSVSIYLLDNEYENVLKNIIKPVLKAKPDFSKFDLILFDLTGKSKMAEEALLLAPTIGDGNLHCTLEDDRLFGIEIMEEAGINVPEYEAFDDLGDAKRFVRKTKKRYVFKPNGGQSQDTATTYVSKDSEDMLRYMDKLGSLSKGVEFILQEVVSGTEISTEAYFNGEEFFLINGTLEEKKFMNGNKGPNTGCAGNLVWTYLREPYVFKEGLKKMKDFLQDCNFRGMVDLNTIVSDTQLYGLEWTPRFGYDASATLFSLIHSDLGDFLGEIASGGRPNYQIEGAFAAAVRLSIPPYPTEIPGKHPEDIPIQGLEEDDCLKECYLYDVYLDNSNELVTAGVNGFIAVPMARGESIIQAFERTYSKVEKINIPDMQYRTDLLETISKRYKTLDRQGWFS